MQKLIIQDIKQLNPHWYVVRFSGDDRLFDAMKQYLGQQKTYNAYYDASQFDGKGGWVVRLDFFKRLSSRFANLERGLVIADRNAAQKVIAR